jgi:hypothetical protein
MNSLLKRFKISAFEREWKICKVNFKEKEKENEWLRLAILG